MEIRDILHGSISIEPNELKVIDSPYFQRLRQIKQLGFSEFSFPSASHNRYIHSIGAMHVAARVFDSIFSDTKRHVLPIRESARQRFRSVLRFATLLHDIGHGPLSHTTEFAMPGVDLLKIPVFPQGLQRKATHEDFTLKIILDSGLTPILESAGRAFGFRPVHVAGLVDSAISVLDDFFIESIDGERVDFRPLLQQIVSSELDADRMDYLRRDSLCAGVSYGEFDFDWLVSNLTGHIRSGKCYLTLEHRALYTFEDFLISRLHMFLTVYLHYKGSVYDEMLAKYFGSPDCDYKLPHDIEAYVNCDDAHLLNHLNASRNPWARRIIDKKPFKVLIEIHSGIPASEKPNRAQKQLVQDLEENLKVSKIPYIANRSESELSKYAGKPGEPIYVRYDNIFTAPQFLPLEECTDLFERYSEKRSITRIYVSPEDYARCQGLSSQYKTAIPTFY